MTRVHGPTSRDKLRGGRFRHPYPSDTNFLCFYIHYNKGPLYQTTLSFILHVNLPDRLASFAVLRQILTNLCSYYTVIGRIMLAHSEL